MPDIPFSTLAFPPDVDVASPSSGSDPTPSVTFPSSDFTDDGAGYWGFGLSVSTQWISGLAGAPLAAPARTQCVFWRQHSEMSIKVLEFACARIGLPPIPPHINTGTTNDVLLTRFLSAPTPMDMPDGPKVIMLVGRYYYMMQMSQALDDAILIPNSALRLPAFIQLYPSQFNQLLAGPTLPPPGFNNVPVNW